MKIADVIKQLSALKKIHGNLPVTLINPSTGYTQPVRSLHTEHPLNGILCYDRSKPAVSIIVTTR